MLYSLQAMSETNPWGLASSEVHCVFIIHQMTKSVTSPDELGALASHVTVDYSQLAVQGRLAARTAEPEEVRTREDKNSSAAAVWQVMLQLHACKHFYTNVFITCDCKFLLLSNDSMGQKCTVFMQIGFQIKTRVQELGHGCIYLVQKAGALQITPSDSFTKRELIDCARAVTEKVPSSNLTAFYF